MRILFLCTDAYGGHGGIALFNRDLIEAMAAHPRVERVVVLPRLVAPASAGGSSAIPPGVDFIAGAGRGRLAYVRSLRAALRATKFDLVFCGHINLLPIACAASPNPLLLTHGIDAWKPLRSPLSNRLIHRCRGIISISRLTQRRLLRWSRFSGPTYLLPNAIRPELYGIRPRNAEMAAKYRIAGGRVLLTVGRLAAQERYKGFDEVLETLPALSRTQPDITYVIAGDGNDLPRLRQKARLLGVAERVVFTGLFDDTEKADLYSLADVYVMPSRGEGFGFVFLEAMASGVPVIGSKHDGGREALRDGELGTLVDPSNPAEIRTAILDALAHGERQIPAGLDYFAFPRFAERLHAILDQAVPG